MYGLKKLIVNKTYEVINVVFFLLKIFWLFFYSKTICDGKFKPTNLYLYYNLKVYIIIV